MVNHNFLHIFVQHGGHHRFVESSNFFGDVFSSFFGGLLLVILLFLYRELFQKKTNLTGEWNVENIITSTAYKSYKGLKVVWRLHLLQNENSISGSGEKIREIDPDGTEFELEHAKRDNVELQGFIEKNYFKRNRIFLNVIQEGVKRKTRATYLLKEDGVNVLTGMFINTAADSRGTSSFTREELSY